MGSMEEEEVEDEDEGGAGGGEGGEEEEGGGAKSDTKRPEWKDKQGTIARILWEKGVIFKFNFMLIFINKQRLSPKQGEDSKETN